MKRLMKHEAWRRLSCILGCFDASGCLESMQVSTKCKDYWGVLEQNVLPSARKLCLSHRSQVLKLDSGTKHTAKIKYFGQKVLLMRRLQSLKHLSDCECFSPLWLKSFCTCFSCICVWHHTFLKMKLTRSPVCYLHPTHVKHPWPWKTPCPKLHEYNRIMKNCQTLKLLPILGELVNLI